MYTYFNIHIYINIYLKQEKLNQSESEIKITIEKIESLQQINIQLNEELLDIKVILLRYYLMVIYFLLLLIFFYAFLAGLYGNI
jgi:hypothetical protein